MSWNRDSDYWKAEYERLQGASAQPPEPKETERRHLWDRSAVSTLALLAVVSGVFLGLAAFVVAILAGWGRPWAWGLGGWAIVQAAAWAALIGRWLDLTKPLERALGVDLNRDGIIEGRSYDPDPVRIEVIEDGGQRGIYADLPYPDKLPELGAGLVSGVPFAEAAWTGSGRPFSRSQFRELREIFFRRAFLEWANPEAHNQGVRLSKSGQAVCRYFASMAASPSPTLTARTPEK